MFTVEMDGDKSVIGKLDSLPERLALALRATVTRLAMLLRAKIQQEKLQGQVLKHRTGKLSRSIEEEVISNPDSIIGRVFSNGTAPYAAAHEFGFNGTEHVASFTRRQTMAFGRPITPITVTVNAFDRHMTIPEKSFIRSTFRENAALIEKSLIETVARVVGEGASQ